MDRMMKIKHLLLGRFRRGPFLGRWFLPGHFSIISLLIIVGCVSEHSNEGDGEAPPETPVPVDVAEAQIRTLHPSVDLVGTLVAIPERTALIAAQCEGQIQQVTVVEGDVVKSGQILVQLDSRQAKAEVKRAEGVVGQRQAILDRLKHGYLPQEIEIARQATRKTKAELEGLRVRVEASAKLRENSEVSDVEFAGLQSALRSVEADHASAGARLALLQAGPRPEEIAEAESQLATAQADLARARLSLAFCDTTSPIDGVVTRLTALQGMNVVPADQLATVVDRSELFVRLRVPSTYLSSIKPGVEVEVNVGSFEGETVRGHVARLGGEADPNTGDIDAFAVIPNPSGHLRPGLGCRARVWLPQIDHALAVAVSAIADRDGTTVVSLVRDGRAYETEVAVGVETEGYMEVVGGLSAGDVVIIQGGYGLPDGCPVQIRSG
jgi:multidrug efflux pump subunit AcrA (membrane-fusion protein)